LGGASWLVVDEASQMPVPVLLALASLTHPSEGHVLAGGDHRQLACINAYDDASADLRPSFVRHLPFHTAYDYLLELHARAGSARVTVSRLSFSHRLNPVVRHLVSPIYEEDGITLSGCNPDPNELGAESGRTLDEVLCAIWKADEGLFLLVHNNEGCMKQNALEARLIRQLLDQGAQFGHVSPKDVGIITPHKLQAEELRRQLQPRCSGSKAGRGLDSIEASTVDKFQGDERNTIIFSGCVSSVAGMASNEAFYTSPNRANVAFTRAKHRLVVCCSEQLLSYLPVDPQRYSQMQLIKRLSHMCVDAGRLLFKGPIPWANGNMVRVYEGAMA
ncbi:AAA domain-containing protein, partial [Dunaliella salina]